MDDFENPLATVNKYQHSPPVDVDSIARDLGIKVYYTPLGPSISGQIMRDRVKGGSSGFAIYVNSSDPKTRQRFTLAHELAHYILHRDLIDTGVVDDTMYRSQELSSVFEVQANKMAADILMPIRLVKKLWDRNPDSAGELAKQFGVSLAAMEIRLKPILRSIGA